MGALSDTGCKSVPTIVVRQRRVCPQGLQSGMRYSACGTEAGAGSVYASRGGRAQGKNQQPGNERSRAHGHELDAAGAERLGVTVDANSEFHVFRSALTSADPYLQHVRDGTLM